MPWYESPAPSIALASSLVPLADHEEPEPVMMKPKKTFFKGKKGKGKKKQHVWL